VFTLGRVAVYVVMALSMIRLLRFEMVSADRMGLTRPSLDWSVLALALTGIAGILIHEAGHYFAGLSAGQFCRRVVIGPLEWARREGKWRARWIPLRRAGLVDMVPSTFHQFRLRRAICVAGGPAASMLTGMAFLVLSLQASSLANSAPIYWIGAYSALWSLSGLLGLLPMRRGDARSDGYLLWQLLRGGTTVDELQRNLLVASSHATPLRLRDWPRHLIDRLADVPEDGQPREYNAYLAYVHFLDRGEPHVARRYLESLVADWTRQDPPEYALEAAWFRATHDGDLDSARRWLAFEERSVEPWVRLRAEAAVERAAGNPDRAQKLTAEALTQLNAVPSCGAYEYEKDRLRELR